GAWGTLSTNATLSEQARRAAHEHVQRVLDQIGYKKHSIEYLLRVVEGHPAEIILREAQRTKADLIVIGAQKRTGIFDFGSTARAVLQGAPTAVWVQSSPVRRIERILAPVDLSEHSLRSLESACALARELHARVRTLHCFQAASYVATTWPEGPDMASAY